MIKNPEILTLWNDLCKNGLINVKIKRASGTKCPRCWKYIKNKPEYVVCPRCFFVMLEEYIEFLTERDYEWYRRRDKIYLETGKFPEQVEQGQIEERYYKNLPEIEGE